MRNIKRNLIILIIALFIIILGTLISFAKTGVVNVEQVVVRKGPSTSTEILTGLNDGVEVEILGEEDGFYKIKYNDGEGYVRADLLTIKEEQSKTNETENEVNNIVTENVVEQQDNIILQENNTTVVSEFPKEMALTTNVKVFILPVISSNIISSIETGNTIFINKTLNNWSYIAYGNIIGWVRNYNLSNSIEINDSVEEQTSEITTGYINASSVNVREMPDTSANILTTLARNTEITLVSLEGEWYKIQYGDIVGYISKELITNNQAETTSRENSRQEISIETRAAYICVGVANIREKASTSSIIITTLRKKDEIEIVGEEGEFYKIVLGNGTVAYVAKRLVVESLDEIIETADTSNNEEKIYSTEGTASGEGVVTFAKQFLGYNYVYGGTHPGQGFDCSGFTSYVFNSCGYSLSRTCSTQQNEGIYVEKENLQLGDLLLFNNTSSGAVGHVGIYIGDGRFIHASNPTRGVVTDTINSGYYYTYYYGARRIV